MKVIDASVVVELVCSYLDPERLGDEILAAPHLIDTEVLHTLRRLVRLRDLTEAEGTRALATFSGMIINRQPVMALHDRIWALRHNLTAYDASYVALAEALGATSLLTSDARLAKAPGLQCHVEVL